MGWFQKCCETYDSNSHMIGAYTPGYGDSVLAPFMFQAQKAQIEITLTSDGSFYSANVILKEDSATIIPMTEKSMSRTSGTEAHPLCDQLVYIAPGVEKIKEGKKSQNVDLSKFAAFISQLGKWAASEYSHDIVHAVYVYCCGGTVISDLSARKIVTTDENGKLAAGKIEGTEYAKCLVRWSVLSDVKGRLNSWEDTDLFECYKLFYLSGRSDEKKDICYVNGKEDFSAASHPKGILKTSSGAKLISSNDTAGLTYRGRFENDRQAVSVGIEASQKAHSALRWVAENQGVINGGRLFLCWNPSGRQLPKLSDICCCYYTAPTENENAGDRPLTMPAYKDWLHKLLDGYKTKIGGHEDVLIMVLDSATTGRLSITYYNELKASDFLSRVEKWHHECSWYFGRDIRPPRIYDIVRYAFGTEQGERVAVDGKIVREQYQRILCCVTDSMHIPSDIAAALTQRAAMRQAYKRKNYERLLSVACAVVRKFENDKHGKEVWGMELDMENHNRSYLFGRLLAVIEYTEKITYYGSDVSRETNAERYQTAFVSHPLRTWAVLELALKPYFKSLKPSKRQLCKNMIGEIVALINESDTKDLNKSLDDVYLLGYYLQRKELWRGKSADYEDMDTDADHDDNVYTDDTDNNEEEE